MKFLFFLSFSFLVAGTGRAQSLSLSAVAPTKPTMDLEAGYGAGCEDADVVIEALQKKGFPITISCKMQYGGMRDTAHVTFNYGYQLCSDSFFKVVTVPYRLGLPSTYVEFMGKLGLTVYYTDPHESKAIVGIPECIANQLDSAK